MYDNGNNSNHHDVTRQLADVNHIQCALVAREIPELARMRQAADPFSLTEKSKQDQTAALFHLVGICNRLNWDFVLGPLAAEMWELTDGFSSKSLESIQERTFKKAFGAYRRDDGGLNYKRRLESLRTIGRYIRDHNSVQQILNSDKVLGESGVASVISRVPIYNEDPLLKKCNALLHELVRRNLISVSDPQEIEPAIDYHIMRLYLRTGRVMILDDDVSKRLQERRRVRIEVITQIRKAVADALKYTAWLANVSVSSLNDVEWAFARRACRRDQVWCSNCIAKCPLDQVCPSAYLSVKRMVTEPDSKHGHY